MQADAKGEGFPIVSPFFIIPSLGDCVVIGEMVKNVMLNLFQHLIESNTYETLNQVQGDKKGLRHSLFDGRG
jgi:hypothetical protein